MEPGREGEGTPATRNNRGRMGAAPPLRIVVVGTDLPGRQWGPGPDGPCYRDIHVFLGRRDRPANLVPADAPSATWRLEVAVKPDGASGFDFGGPLVLGKRGERYLGLHWGVVGSDGTFTVVAGTKLRLADIEPATLRRALQPGRLLIGRLGLTSPRGGPRCASVRPPDIEWSVSDE